MERVSVTDPPAPDGRATADVVVRLRGVSKRFGHVVALDSVDLEVRRGEIIALIGSSGSGKTTVLRTVIGLESIDGGAIEIDGELVAGTRLDGSTTDLRRAREIRRDRLGMVFQSFNLFPHRTALENVTEAPIHVKGATKAQARAQAMEMLGRVGVADRAGHYPAQLSGGQQQRVAIARTLAMDPEVILFDEVTSALDPELTGEVLAVMVDLAREGQTMMVVTHEIGFARQVATNVVYMDYGRVVESGSPSEVLDAPIEERTKAFLSTVLRFGD
jgi:polar amino acid transport system ATP-binding protein